MTLRINLVKRLKTTCDLLNKVEWLPPPPPHTPGLLSMGGRWGGGVYCCGQELTAYMYYDLDNHSVTSLYLNNETSCLSYSALDRCFSEHRTKNVSFHSFVSCTRNSCSLSSLLFPLPQGVTNRCRLLYLG